VLSKLAYLTLCRSIQLLARGDAAQGPGDPGPPSPAHRPTRVRETAGRGIEHQIQNLALHPPTANQEAMCRQTPGLAPRARNCDHIATKPRVTGGDGCPTRITDIGVDQEKRGREGSRRTGGDGRCMTTDLAVGGSNPSRRAPKPQLSGPVMGPLLVSSRRTATKLRPRWRAVPTRLRPPATTIAHAGSIAAGQPQLGGRRPRRVTLCIGSHWPFDQWGRFLPEHTTAVSLLDRLLHHSIVVVTQGESSRMRQAKARRGAPTHA